MNDDSDAVKNEIIELLRMIKEDMDRQLYQMDSMLEQLNHMNRDRVAVERLRDAVHRQHNPEIYS